MLEQLTPTSLITQTLHNTVKPDIMDPSAIHILSQGLGATLEGGIVSGGLSLMASAAVMNLNVNLKEDDQKNVTGVLDTMEQLKSVGSFLLPNSMKGLADVVGHVASAGAGAVAGVNSKNVSLNSSVNNLEE